MSAYIHHIDAMGNYAFTWRDANIYGSSINITTNTLLSFELLIIYGGEVNIPDESVYKNYIGKPFSEHLQSHNKRTIDMVGLKEIIEHFNTKP